MVGVEFLVVIGGADKKKSATGREGAAIIFGSGVMQASRSEFGILTKRNFPEIFAGIEVDGVQCAPWSSHRGITIGIEKAVVAGEVIFHGRRRGSLAGNFFTLGDRR